jgi:hypothetical protein
MAKVSSLRSRHVAAVAFIMMGGTLEVFAFLLMAIF